MYMKNIVYIRFNIIHGLKLSTGDGGGGVSQNISPAGKGTTVMLGQVNSMPIYPVVQTLVSSLNSVSHSPHPTQSSHIK